MDGLRHDEYRLSQRVTLKRGHRFRANGGPQFQLTSGEKVSLAAPGPFVFLAHWKHGGCEYIEALDRHGNFVPLHITGERRSVSSEIITRPYRLRNRLRMKGGR